MQMPAPVLADYGQLRASRQDASGSFGFTVEANEGANHFKLTRGERNAPCHRAGADVNMEVSSRSGAGCTCSSGSMDDQAVSVVHRRGATTLGGNFPHSNKAVWPPWNAYWGEYNARRSSGNPAYGARPGDERVNARQETGRVDRIHRTTASSPTMPNASRAGCRAHSTTKPQRQSSCTTTFRWAHPSGYTNRSRVSGPRGSGQRLRPSPGVFNLHAKTELSSRGIRHPALP